MTVPVEKTTETEAPPAEKETPQPSLRERQEAIFDKFAKTEAGGSDSPAAEVEPAAESSSAQATKPVGSEEPAVEAAAVEVERIEVSDDQLRDLAYWRSLNTKEDWARMERDYPAETANFKASQAAATKIVNEARKTVQSEKREAPLPDDEPSPEYLAAVEMTYDLDPKVAAKGHRKIAELNAEIVARKIGIDPQRTKQSALATTAYENAVAVLPELAGYADEELNAVVESTRALKALVSVGTVEAISEAMIGAGEILRDRKKNAAATAAATKAAADTKKKDTQKVVQSNASLASAEALKPHGASPDTRTYKQRQSDAYDREVARQGGTAA